MPPTREQHDTTVAAKGRPYTQDPMREARPVDVDATDSGLSPIDRVRADARYHANKATS